jgi:hypothetical protein
LAHDLSENRYSLFRIMRSARPSTNAAAGLNFLVWREEDFMWRHGSDFGVIPRPFCGEKESSAALRPRAFAANFGSLRNAKQKEETAHAPCRDQG